ncbi:hypothetical protein CEUSTIGMA_g4450.t1 [Chlamydomonas eustigma]|uniref:Protein kinase domain-containing protein n=1 Tax=Chlamydomonas eustigma TaxID=1157962 RepID=A0A250X1N9_9CHLO|nr:hypothetical protein CEUSTIGMA_g4450.t1 [Chlamydomonas eustigma]|eukprot:GAX77003.1 hypothetical protein CEUSTIGMA_g4450.t1 [Chlamydomonas eustigma]
MIARKEWRKADFQLIELLHKGYASLVYKAVSKHGLGSVALKVYNMDKLEELQRYQVYREIRIHSQVQHTNLIRLLLAFQEGNEVVLVQELAEGGDLFELLREHPCGEEINSGGVRLPEGQAVDLVIHPLLRALHNLHTRGIMHRDIKTENIVFKNGVMKLADFGLAINMREESPVTRAGTLDYMAPEVVRCPRKTHPMENKDDHGLHYGPGADVWAVGVLSFELITGCVPFSGSNSKESVGGILSRNPSFPSHVSESARSFILQALMKHPRDRASVLELLHHPWVQSLQHRASLSRKSSLLSTSLKTSPSSTLGDSPFSSGISNSFNERNSPDYKPPAMFTTSSHSPLDDTGLPSSLSNAASSGAIVCSDTDGLDGRHPSPVLLQGSRDQGTPTKSEGSTLADVKPCPLLLLSHTRSSSIESSSLLAVSGDDTNPDKFSSKKKCMRQLPTSFSMFLAEGTASEGSSVAVSQSRLQSSNIIGRTPREIAEMISQLVLRRLSSSKLTLTSRAGSMASDS